MNKDIRKKYIVPPGCQEQFLPIDEDILSCLRMEEGAKLLTHTTRPLRVIAERMGYETAFSFSTAFKKVHGCSPREYRHRAGIGRGASAPGAGS